MAEQVGWALSSRNRYPGTARSEEDKGAHSLWWLSQCQYVLATSTPAGSLPSSPGSLSPMGPGQWSRFWSLSLPQFLPLEALWISDMSISSVVLPGRALSPLGQMQHRLSLPSRKDALENSEKQKHVLGCPQDKTVSPPECPCPPYPYVQATQAEWAHFVGREGIFFSHFNGAGDLRRFPW